jgi:hypothetical protein
MLQLVGQAAPEEPVLAASLEAVMRQCLLLLLLLLPPLLLLLLERIHVVPAAQPVQKVTLLVVAAEEQLLLSMVAAVADPLGCQRLSLELRHEPAAAAAAAGAASASAVTVLPGAGAPLLPWVTAECRSQHSEPVQQAAPGPQFPQFDASILRA